MRIQALAFSVLAISALALGAAQGAETDPSKLAYPGAVALSQTPAGYVYKQFPSLVYLYIRDGDGKEKSDCGDKDGCYSAWPPLLAGSEDHPIGDWTIISRDDGLKQWAYKGKPVYRRFHDIPDDMTGPASEGFHLLRP